MSSTSEVKKEQSRLRSEKHYNLKKAAILEQRKIQYQKNKPVIIKEIVIPVITNNSILKQRLNEIDMTEHTKTKYLSDIDRLFTTINDNDLQNELKNGVAIVKQIKDSNYAGNTKAGMIQMVLYLINKFNLPVEANELLILQTYFKEVKVSVEAGIEIKKLTETVMTWKDYMNLVVNEFGLNSKMFVISSLYREVTMRDDFQLKLVTRKPKTTNENYLVLNKNNYKLIINNYKTDQTYGQISIKLSRGLTKTIELYIQTNNLKNNDYLFGDSQQSGFIRYSNTKIGVDGGISMYRHMTCSELVANPKTTAADKVRIAKRMAHSVYLQGTYCREFA